MQITDNKFRLIDKTSSRNAPSHDISWSPTNRPNATKLIPSTSCCSWRVLLLMRIVSVQSPNSYAVFSAVKKNIAARWTHHSPFLDSMAKKLPHPTPTSRHNHRTQIQRHGSAFDNLLSHAICCAYNVIEYAKICAMMVHEINAGYKSWTMTSSGPDALMSSRAHCNVVLTRTLRMVGRLEASAWAPFVCGHQVSLLCVRIGGESA